MTKRWSATKSGDGLTKRAASKRRRNFLRLTDEEIQMFDKALIASSELLYELPVR